MAYDETQGRAGRAAKRRAKAAVSSLTDLEMRILAFERSQWRSHGAKEREILEVFELSPTRYYQLLNELIDTPAAAQFDPVLVARLRRRRDARGQFRSAE
ncbi:MAG TPA: DUF3263 domain-containing protein [Streptosporangiaceae bacterium]|nr:DUF3263 domain-containing protein [Streptosporangiaceae bacterium]